MARNQQSSQILDRGGEVITRLQQPHVWRFLDRFWPVIGLHIGDPELTYEAAVRQGCARDGSTLRHG